MQLFDLTLTAGDQQQVTIKGRFFRMLSGAERIKLETDNGVSSSVITGVGLDLRTEDGAGFQWIRLTSPIDQTVTVLVSDMPTTDSRLSGDVDVNGLLSVVNAGGSGWASSTQALTAATPGQVLVPANSERLDVSIQADVDMWIGADNTVTTATGLRVTAGTTMAAENTGALYCATLADGTARIMESIK